MGYNVETQVGEKNNLYRLFFFIINKVVIIQFMTYIWGQIPQLVDNFGSSFTYMNIVYFML